MPNGTSPPPPKIILASASPRRRALLADLNLAFDVEPAPFDEASVNASVPEELVMALARGKARAVAKRHPDALVIGADTAVIIDGEVLGKPRDVQDAHRMLRRLAGRTHRVLTGVALCHLATGREAVAYESTDVTFGPLSDDEIARYIATGEPMDKAGAYGIQGYGAVLVQGVKGCYFNVVGLPLYRLARMLRAFGVEVF
ncbi:MAG TPA: Maf family protein [Limnochordia bacterium]|nr:Maf family protein [Limnochordia bacterium]